MPCILVWLFHFVVINFSLVIYKFCQVRHQNFHDWSTGYAVKVFCDTDKVYGCDEGSWEGGGWMRVADVNMVHVHTRA